MASSLSFSELTALYANKSKAAKPLFEPVAKASSIASLPGATTKEKISKLFETRQNGLPPARPTAWPSDKEQRSIAICLVIVDTVHHEDIWREWMDAANSKSQQTGNSSSAQGTPYKAELFIHAKNPESVKSDWVKSKLIDITFNPQWNSVEVVQAMLSTLDAALQHQSFCGRFVFGTESCLPLLPLQRLGEVVFAQECSWLSAYHTPQDKYDAAAAFAAVNSEIVPAKVVWKSLPGWIMLTRKHAAEIVALVNLLGGWGQPGPALIEGDNSSTSASGASASSAAGGSSAVAGEAQGWYKGTQGVRWRLPAVVAAGTGSTVSCGTRTGTDVALAACSANGVSSDESKEQCPTGPLVPAVAAAGERGETAQLSPHTPLLGGATLGDTSSGASTELTTSASTPTPTTSRSGGGGGGGQAALLDAWATVHAPEEVFFPTLLALLGYLRDGEKQTSSSGGTTQPGHSNNSSGPASKTPEVRIAMVNFAEWARRGDAHPVQYDYIDAHLVQRMTAAGALFGRKFAAGSVTVSQWRAAMGELAAQADSTSGGHTGREERGEHGGWAERSRDRAQYSSYGRGHGSDQGYSYREQDSYSQSGGYRSSYSDQHRGGNYNNDHSGRNYSSYDGSSDRGGHQGGDGYNKRRRY